MEKGEKPPTAGMEPFHFLKSSMKRLAEVLQFWIRCRDVNKLNGWPDLVNGAGRQKKLHCLTERVR
uniref:Uncharacterized protein n=1 Tax=Geobacter metallireducens TaxID=28232 RepID=A0A831UIT6_GEOME